MENTDVTSVQIALFRSKDDDASNYAPLYPYQRRSEVFLAVVNMIANTMTFSEDAALKQMGVVIAGLVCSPNPPPRVSIHS